MTTQNYLMVQENIVTNLCVWDGNTQTWQPPSDATMLIAETTATKVWGYSSGAKDYVLVDSMDDASIGFVYDGTYCITNEPKPELPTPAENQPVTEGTQDL
jgi:hypothetical protein